MFTFLCKTLLLRNDARREMVSYVDEFNPQKKPLDQSCVECQQDLMASDVGYEAAVSVRSGARLLLYCLQLANDIRG